MTAEKRIATAEKQARALQFRASGATFAQIGLALGCSTTRAWQLVEAGLDRTVREPAEALVALECDRLDRMQLAIWPRVLKGDLHAIDAMLKIMARRAKLLGLDAPAKHEITRESIMKGAAEKAAERYGLDPREVLAQAEALFKELSS